MSNASKVAQNQMGIQMQWKKRSQMRDTLHDHLSASKHTVFMGGRQGTDVGEREWAIKKNQLYTLLGG